MSVRVRFAPSPTGYLHIGGARTALFSWLYARKHGGSFILRIEDTDLERSSQESVNAILEGMTWLGLEYDEGPFYQTKRFDRYKEVVQQLLEQGEAYYCYCSKEEIEAVREQQKAKGDKPRYNGKCRHGAQAVEGVQPVVRFKTPLEGVIAFDDMVHGRITTQNNELDDLIIARSDGSPTYNLTVVVDDYDMKLSHVIRGDDHINNTPRQLHIFRALGAEPPKYAHVPLIMGKDGRLSKRHGAVSVMQYKEDGYLPEALLNYLIRLGWSHGDQEVFSVDEMIKLFDIEDVNKAASTFNGEKLLWLNQHHIQNASLEHLVHHLSWHLGRLGIDPSTGPNIQQVVAALQQRAKTLVEMAQGSEFFYKDIELDEAAAKKHLRPVVREYLLSLAEGLASLSQWEKEPIHALVEAVAEKFAVKLGKVAQPLRVALSGGSVSPPIDITVELLGKKLCLERIAKAVAYIDLRETQS